MKRWALLAVAALALVCCRESQLPHSPPAVQSPFDRADTLYRAAKYQEAADAYAQLRERFATEGHPSNQWRARLWWVKSMHYLGRNKELAGEFEPLLEMSAGDPVRQAWTRCTRGMVHARAARFNEALEDGQFGLGIGVARNENSLVATCYDTLVTALSNAGRYRESLALSEKRLAIERARGSNPFDLADALNDIGVDYRHLGRFEEAIKVYEEGFALYQKLDNPEGMAKVLFNLGNIHRALGDVQKDLELKRRSLQHAEKMGHAWGLGMLHGDLGEIFHKAENFPQARVHLAAAIAIGREANLPLVEVNALEDLGRTEAAARNHARAREVLAMGMAMADDKKLQAYRSQIRSAAARNEAAGGLPAEAIGFAEEALRIARELDDPEIEFEALEARALALEAARRPDASAAFLEGVELLESWRGRLALGDLRIGVAERRLGVYEGAIRLLLQQGQVDESLEIAERARARVLLALMAGQDARESSRSAEEDLKQRLREAYEARRSVSASLRPALDRRIAELTTRLAETEKLLRAAQPARSKLRNPRPAAIGEIREALLADGEALLAFFWGDRDVYGWWLERSGGRAAHLGSVESLAPVVDYARMSVEQGTEWHNAASRAYRALVQPLQPGPARKLFVVSDGPASNLPLEVLISENNRPWGATTEFTYGPSASVLLTLSKRGGTRQYARELLAVGNPRAGRFPVLASLTRSRPGELASLPYAAREVREVAKIVGKDSDLLLGADATTAEWISRRPEQYRYLHFATHARVDDRQPMKTALTMADGELEVRRIREMSLQSELVTLSACQTALGPRVRGEGVIGLPHAFLSAGARGVIVTLWRVPDQSTARFVRDVYSEIHKGSPPSRALHQTRQRWIEAGAPPSQWASFIIIGGNA